MITFMTTIIKITIMHWLENLFKLVTFYITSDVDLILNRFFKKKKINICKYVENKVVVAYLVAARAPFTAASITG